MVKAANCARPQRLKVRVGKWSLHWLSVHCASGLQHQGMKSNYEIAADWLNHGGQKNGNAKAS